MRKIILMVIVLSHFFCSGSLNAPWLSDNVKIEKVSAVSPANNQVIVSITVVNNNSFKGKITVGTDVNCGTVSWREKKKDVIIEPNSKATVEIKFEGIRDRIPTMAEKAEIQTRLYNSSGKEIEESGKFIIHKKYGYPG
jgi:hypothetical protein